MVAYYFLSWYFSIQMARIIFYLILVQIGSLGFWKYWKATHFDSLWTWKYWITNDFDNWKLRNIAVLWVSELILWVSELISLVLGVWTYTFGHQRTKHSEDPWIWEYWRTKHSGMTRESGNTEGPSILIWPVNLEILKDQSFWYNLCIWKYCNMK